MSGRPESGTLVAAELAMAALVAVAARRAERPGRVRAGTSPPRVDPRGLAALATGLDGLRRAVGAAPCTLPAARGSGPGDPDERLCQLLDEAADLLGDLVAAGRPVVLALSAVGAEPAAEYADGITVAASTLRILVELERAAIATS